MEEGVAYRKPCNRMHLSESLNLPALATVKTDICLSSTEPSPLYLPRFVGRCAKGSSLCVSPTVSSCFYFYLFLRKKNPDFPILATFRSWHCVALFPPSFPCTSLERGGFPELFHLHRHIDIHPSIHPHPTINNHLPSHGTGGTKYLQCRPANPQTHSIRVSNLFIIITIVRRYTLSVCLLFSSYLILLSLALLVCA